MKLFNRFAEVTRILLSLVVMGITVSGYAFAQPGQLWIEKPQAPKQDRALNLLLFSDLTERLSPAVVNIRVLERVQAQPYWDYPWGLIPPSSQNPPGEQFMERGEASGFIIHQDGYILTNAHVVLGSDEIQVALNDGRLFRGEVIGVDEVMDIGLVKIKSPDPLPFLPLGSSARLKTGEWVMAIGSPFGLEQTVTVGIVSAKGRWLGFSPFDDFIQISAPINPGNSGGPLLNTNGEVVGINTMILAQGQGLGFSLPIDPVKIVLPQLKEKGRVERSWLGVVVQEITIDIKERLKLKAGHGAYLVQVVHDSPASRAGLREGDVIISFNGKKIRNSRELPLLSAHAPAGKPLPVVIIRDGKKMTLTVVLEKVPATARR